MGVTQEITSRGWKKEDRILGLYAIAMALFLVLGVVSSTAIMFLDLVLPWHIGKIVRPRFVEIPWPERCSHR